MSAFSLVPSMVGAHRKPTRDDPAIYRDAPSERDERELMLRLVCESPRCALNQDSEAGACDLRCPECGARGAWQDGREGTGPLVVPDWSAVDCEPYLGRKRVSPESAEVWRCRKGHETKEPVRPNKEPRGAGGAHSKMPTSSRNSTEDRLVLLCSIH